MLTSPSSLFYLDAAFICLFLSSWLYFYFLTYQLHINPFVPRNHCLTTETILFKAYGNFFAIKSSNLFSIAVLLEPSTVLGTTLIMPFFLVNNLHWLIVGFRMKVSSLENNLRPSKSGFNFPSRLYWSLPFMNDFYVPGMVATIFHTWSHLMQNSVRQLPLTSIFYIHRNWGTAHNCSLGLSHDIKTCMSKCLLDISIWM